LPSQNQSHRYFIDNSREKLDCKMFPQSDGLKSYFINAFRVVNHSKASGQKIAAIFSLVFLKLKLLHKNKGTLKTSEIKISTPFDLSIRMTL
jgi:hypothetical protein